MARIKGNNQLTDKHLSCLKIAVALNVRGTFTYSVPEELKSEARIGCRALIPFNNRKVIGYILGRTPPNNDCVLKDILDILDSDPLFHEQMVPFFEWVADYYIHPIGMVIQSALPGGLNRKSYKTAFLTEKGLEALERLPSHYEAAGLLSWVKENAGKRLPWTLTKIKPFQRKGWLIIKDITRKGRAGPLMKRFVRLQEGVDLQSIFDGKFGPLKSKNEAEFLKAVSSHNTILVRDLTEKFANGSYLANKWIKKGILESGTVPVYRNPAGEMISPVPVPVELYEQQELSLGHLINYLNKGTFCTNLLFGVTGSGKTEVYYRVVEHVIGAGRQAILMVPEIALAVYMEGFFRSRLGDRVAIYHSGLSQGERHDQWMMIAGGDADLVIGARSALFAPLPRLGLIIVDEEHDSTYKQESNLRYQARDAAVMRAKMEKALVILGSGTPSIQSFQNSINGRYHLLSMPERVEKRPLPNVEIIDMKPLEGKRSRKGILSPELRKAVRQNLAARNQTLLFLNRRGFHRLFICWSCGKPVSCPNCDIALTYHLKEDRLTCHYCGFYSGTRMKCPSCGYGKLRPYGFGTEKLEQDLKLLFPDARIARMDTDSTRRKGQAFDILRKFGAHEIDILVGTQMITKGYDFQMVTLVGVIAADLSLGFPDFRAGERTFQILSQVAGRAGRGMQRGRVIIQTFNPEHYAIRAATGHNFQLFFRKERELRSQLGYPPFSHLAILRLNGNSEIKTSQAAHYLSQNIRGVLNKWPKKGKDLKVLGPVEAPISRLKGKYRWQILIKSKSVSLLHHLLNEVEARSRGFLRSSGVQLVLDIDPYQMT